MGQTIQGLWDLYLFLHNVSRDVCHSAAYPPLPSGALCPLDLLHLCHSGSTLPRQAFSDSCLRLLSLGQRFPNFSEIPLPAFHLVCQLPSDLFARMFLLDIISSLIRKRETHILSSHPLPLKQLSFPSCLLLFQPHPFPYSNL